MRDEPSSGAGHHLRVLADAGILDRERRGTWSWYTLRPAPFEMLQDALRPGSLLHPSPTCDDNTDVPRGDVPD